MSSYPFRLSPAAYLGRNDTGALTKKEKIVFCIQ
jgi:hypothetical protein